MHKVKVGTCLSKLLACQARAEKSTRPLVMASAHAAGRVEILTVSNVNFELTNYIW